MAVKFVRETSQGIVSNVPPFVTYFGEHACHTVQTLISLLKRQCLILIGFSEKTTLTTLVHRLL